MQSYLDPEGGYEDPDEGFRAELAAMTGQPRVNVNALPTKAYLEATITPTVMRAFSRYKMNIPPINQILLVIA